MENAWFKTQSTNNGSLLNNPEKTINKPDKKFKKYKFPSMWNKFMENKGNLLIYENNNDFIFMSQNQNQLEQFVNLWNSFTEEAADFIDWE